MSVTWDDMVNAGDKGLNTWANDIISAIKRRGAKYVVTTDAYGDYQCDGASDETEINTALNALTAGRTWIEKVLLRGSFTVDAIITVPSYTILEVQGRIKVANNVNVGVLENADSVAGNSHITLLGGVYDGNEANQVGGLNSHAIAFGGACTDLLFAETVVENASYDNYIVHGAGSKDINFINCTANGGRDDGFNPLTCKGVSFTGCVAKNAVNDGFHLSVGSENVSAQGCISHDNGGYGYAVYSQGANLTGNIGYANTNGGVFIEDAADYVNISKNTLSGGNVGIYVEGTVGSTILGVTLDDNKILSPIQWGIHTDYSPKIKVINNYIDGPTTDYDAIGIGEGCDSAHVDVNTTLNAFRRDWTVFAGSTNVYIGSKNNFGGLTFADSGTGTVFDTVNMPFVDGTACEDSGWDIDAGGEYARAFAYLPRTLHKVVSINVYARSIVLEADAMLADFTVNSGLSNEAYNAEAISVAGKVSTTTNFSADDIMYWTLIAADDSDIGDLVGGESLEVKVVHAAAAGGNCETDARFRTVQINYF